MKRVVDVLYGLKGYPNASRFANFKTDLFANGDTPSISVDTAGTNGISVTAAMTGAAILLSSTYVNGVYFNGVGSTSSVGLKFKAGYLGHSIETGTYASTADNGVTLAAANTYNAAFLADDSGSSIGDSVRNLLARTLLTITQAGGSIRSVMGQLKALTGVNLGTGVYTAVQGYLEFAGTHSVASGGKVSGVDVSIEVGASKTLTVASGGYLAGVKIELTAPSGTATVTQTGDCAAVYVDTSGTITDWKVGIDLQNCTTGIDIGSCTTGINFSGTVAGNCIDFSATSVTTGSLLDYQEIEGKVSGYLFNGSMITSVLTGSTIIDDFSCACAHDGLTADTLRMIRRIWSGAMPNGSAVANFVFCEYQWSSAFGDGGSDGGSPIMLSLDCNATIDDSAANVTALDINLAGMTLTSVANVYGISITGMTGVDAAINIAGTLTTGINIAAAATLSNVFTFNAVAGCVGAADVDPKDVPSTGGLGADGHLVIDVGGTPYYIPIFDGLTS